MKAKKNMRSIVSLFLTLLMLGGSFCFPMSASAEELTDFTYSMTELPSAAAGNWTKKTDDGVYFEKADGPGRNLLIQSTEDANIAKLSQYDAFSVETEVYFTAFPSGETVNNGISYTPDEYTLSFLCWVVSGNYNRGIRIDDQGYLYTSPDLASKTDIKLSLNTWTTIKCVFSPMSGAGALSVGNQYVRFSFNGVSGTPSGYIRFFDTRYSWGVKLRNVTIKSMQGQPVEDKEPTADYIACQVNKVTDGMFDLRMISGINSLDYSQVGYTVYKQYKNGDELIAEEQEVSANCVYKAIQYIGADKQTYTVTAEEKGAAYFVAIELNDLAVTTDTMLTIRPWTIKNGIRAYGDISRVSIKSADIIEGERPTITRITDTASQEMTLNYEVDLQKLWNLGYEPWGYAETLVNEWFDGGERNAVFANTYADLNLAQVSNNSANNTDFPDYDTYNPIWNRSTGQATTANAYVRTLSSLKNSTIKKYTESTTLYDEYHGILNSGIRCSCATNPGYFHVDVINGKNYIIDPLGNPFYSMAVNTVNTGSTDNQKSVTATKYGSEENFYKGISSELWNTFGINTVFGSTSTGYPILMNNGMVCVVSISGIGAYMKELGLSVSTGGSAAYSNNNTMNVFDPDFITSVDKSVAATTALYKDQKYLLGYTVDNEVPGGDDMLDRYLTLSPDNPINSFSYATAWTWLKRMTGKVNPSTADVTDEYRKEFLAFVYNRYGKVISEAIDKYDPNHMYLGNRAHTPTKDKEGYLRAMGQYVDVFTINMYGKQDYKTINYVINRIHMFSGKSFIVSEYGVRAMDDAVDMNGYRLGNHTDTACWLFETQAQRAASYESYVLNLIESGICVGWVHYRFRDNDQSLYMKQSEANSLGVSTLDELETAVPNPKNYLYTLSSGASATTRKYSKVSDDTVATSADYTFIQIYKGETDTSNLNHNKGLYDNQMNSYSNLAGSMKAISNNLLGLIEHFEE